MEKNRQDKPRYRNLVFLLADQLRHDAPGFAGGFAATPHMDRLAGEGTAFLRAYTPLPVCGPARRALFTGRHPDSMGAFWNDGFFPLNTPSFHPADNLGQRLKDSGRQGCYVGKWGLGADSAPADFGFATCPDPEEYNGYLAERYPSLTHSGGWMGCESPVALEDSKTHFLARQAANFVETAEEDFFLWVDFGMPHLPCRPSPPFSTMYDPAEIPPWPGYEDSFVNKPYCHRQQVVNWRLEDMAWSEMAGQVARYYGMVSQLDDAIGGILAALERAGRLEDTLIVLTSDHGDMCGNHRMLDKHYVLYDDVVRVPLALWGKGLEPLRSDALVSNCLDLPVTICGLMGLPPLPKTHGKPLPLDGVGARRYITSSSNGQQFGFFNNRMITDGRYKYVWNLTDIDELYDVQSDPGECDNRIGDEALAGLLSELRGVLYDELQFHEDPLLTEWTAPQLLENRKL